MTQQTLGDIATDRLVDMLRKGHVILNHGLVSSRVQTDCAELSKPLRQLYRHFPLCRAASWIDLDLRLVVRRPKARPWSAPEARLYCDGQMVFQPFSGETAIPLLEWGTNYLIARRMNHVLLHHAGVLERDGRALVLPALPGSGKSTLTAALSLSGWRLLSDEFGAYDPDHGAFRAVLKPVALKNESITVIREFAPGAEIGPEFRKTHKGTVAHLAPPPSATRRADELARPGAIVLPRWQAGARTRVEPLQKELAFSALAFNSFNYPVLGEVGFRSALRLARDCGAWRLVYSDLQDALRTLDALWRDAVRDDHTQEVTSPARRQDPASQRP